LTTVVVIAIVGVLVTLMFGVKARQHESRALLSRLRATEGGQIKEVRLHPKRGGGPSTIVDDPGQLGRFAEVMNRLEDWQPQHPLFVRRLYVTVRLNYGREFELEMAMKQPPDRTVFIYGRRGSMYLYRAKSSELWHWLADNGALAAEAGGLDSQSPP